MMRLPAFVFALPMLLASTMFAAANGAVSEFPAGGVVFKAEKDISIAREDLEIGWDHIHVHYVLTSSAEKPLKRTIGFPLASVPQDEDSPDNLDPDWGYNYLDFTATTGGKAVVSKLHEYGWLGNKNITTKLQDLGVPILAAFPKDYEKLARLPKATREKLIADGLVEVDKDGRWLVPKWRYQAVFEWTQTFLPGNNEVDVDYEPRFGADSAHGTYYPGGDGAGDYCIADDLASKLSSYENPLMGPEPLRVGYILKTATNWNGPIGEFHLKIVDKDSMSAFCPPDGLERSSDEKSWTAINFVPKSDLKILFFAQDSGH